nr:probable disease resistance protein RPP1 [Ziziphus jujuba var. spinosa]
MNDVRTIGELGISGADKSTIASIIYDMIFDQYEVSCYLANHGIKCIRQRFHSKNCLHVLDDVDRLKQSDASAGQTDWFGLGSRIVVTRRDLYLLNSKGVNNMYVYERLNPAEAMQLHKLHAFRQKAAYGRL